MENNQIVNLNNLDVAYSSKSDKELKKAHLLFLLMNNQGLANVGTFFIKLLFEFKFPIKKVIKNTMFSHFCGGETMQECDSTIILLHKYKVGTILDFSVESGGSEEAYHDNMLEILATIKKAADQPEIPFCVFKASALTNVSLLEKIQRFPKTVTDDEWRSFEFFKTRFQTLCREAYLASVRIMVDAEESWIQTVVDDFTYQMMALYNQQKPIVYITYQMYRHDRLDELKKAYQEAKNNHYKLGVKLVRGAYLEKEIDYAADNMIRKAIHKTKADTDKAYNDALHFIMKHINVIAICAGTHNEESTLLVTDLMKEYEIKYNHPHVYFAQLLGMSDNISFNLSNLGYNTAKYVPYGPVESVMPYLMRRAKENSAIAGQTSRELSMIKAELKRRKEAGTKVIPLSTKNIHTGNNNDFLYAQ